MGASSSKSSKVQLGQGITSGATSLAAPFFSPSLEQPFASLIINTQSQIQHTSYTGMPAHEDTCMHQYT